MTGVQTCALPISNDKWFGVTYKEDKNYVVKSFVRLIEDGVYQKNLFEDLK